MTFPNLRKLLALYHSQLRQSCSPRDIRLSNESGAGTSAVKTVSPSRPIIMTDLESAGVRTLVSVLYF